jgi:outer membrane pore protein F
MKKTILAVITSSLLATAANAAVVYDKDGQQVDVYGRMQYEAGQMYNKANGDVDNFGGTSLARMGFNGKWATDYDVSLIGKLEWQLVSEANKTSDGNGDDSDTTNISSRYAWLGFDFGNGVQLTFGHIEGTYAELSDVTDVYNTYSGWVENQLQSRWDDSIKLTYNADGWDVRAAYSADDANKEDTYDADESTTAATNLTNKYGTAITDVKQEALYGASVGYTFQIDDVQSIKPVLAYQVSSGKVNDGAQNYDIGQFGLGIGYTYDAFYLGTTYGQVRYSVDDLATEKDTVFAVTTTYKVLPEWTLIAGFGQVDPHNAAEDGLTGKPTGAWGKYYVLGTQYDFTPKAKAYFEYKYNDADASNGAKEDNNYTVGMQYNF